MGNSASDGVDVLIVEDLGQQRLPAARMAAIVRRTGLSAARVVDAGRPASAAALVLLARRRQPRLIVFSVLFADHVDDYLALATALRREGVTGFLAMAGPLPAFAANELLAASPALDGVLCGEAETVLAALARALANAPVAMDPADGSNVRCDNSWEKVPGLACRATDGRVTPSPIALSDLDGEPWPARDDGPLLSPAGYRFATIEGSRGCYHACTFCLPCALGRAAGVPYRLRSIPDLTGEIAALYRQGARLFLFDDEQFLAPDAARSARVAALDSVAGQGLEIGFTVKCRPDDVEPGLFAELRELGLLRVYVGIESGCQASLELFGKRVTPEDNRRALQVLHKLGILADFRMLLFHPWSTLETVSEELAFLQGVLPLVSTCFAFHEVEIYPGTPLGGRLRSEGRAGPRPWPIPYTVPDARVQRLRGVNRLLFGAGSAYAELQSELSTAWYDLRVDERMRGTADRHRRTAERLAEATLTINQGLLEVWQAVLALTEGDDLSAVDQIERRTAEWAQGWQKSIAG